MTQSSNLDDAQTVLLATQLVTESDFGQLELLVAEHRSILTPSLLYRQLLTYLPSDSESIPGLKSFLVHLKDEFKNVSALDERLERSDVQVTSAITSTRRFHELRFNESKNLNDPTYDDELSAFAIQWLRKVEAVSGMPASTTDLLDPFVEERPKLRLWQDAYLIPLLKLQNQFYPGRAENIDTTTLEKLNGTSGVKFLLHFAEQDGDKAQIGRDLDEVVAPWVRGASPTKRRRLSQPDTQDSHTSWLDVNRWMYTTSHDNLSLAAKSFLEWGGPNSVKVDTDDTTSSANIEDLASYVQTGLALVTSSKGTGEAVNHLLSQILDRAASLSVSFVSNADSPAGTQLSEASKADLSEAAVLESKNPITRPSEEVFNFLNDCLSAQHTLLEFKISQSILAIVEMALFGSEEKQKQELRRILQQVPRLTRSQIDWPSVRLKLHGLRAGKCGAQNSDPVAHHFLGRVPISYLEGEFLNALITNDQYAKVNDIYLDTDDPPLNRSVVQDHIVSAIYAAYDNASNGNRTRGSMRRAYDILRAFRDKFPSTVNFTHIDHLIQATHSLSFYQLTLQQGVPFQPATIRIHPNPVSLLEKVLAQNHKAFTKLDDLLEIGRNLVRADLPNSDDPSYPSKSLDERLFDTQHRTTYLAIKSALSDHDFGTAYSYITTRLATSPSQTSDSPFVDDTSWRAAYAAGKYRPSTSPKNLHERISGLSKRMDLLSLALTLTPTPEPLSEILATWRRCEEEMDSLRSQAVQEERDIESQFYGDSTLPGGFAEDRDLDAAETRRIMEKRALSGVGPSYEDEAPMGLFDVAKGAASAFRKSAFPLRGATGQIKVRDQIERDDYSERSSMDEPRSSGEHQRVRKRDVVSNMVTGGLVSGMSWVLGAQPPPK